MKTAPKRNINGIKKLKKKNARFRVARRMRAFVNVHVWLKEFLYAAD
jgi:hypothetical protein